MKRTRYGAALMLLAIGGALVLGGCAKKMGNTDVTGRDSSGTSGSSGSKPGDNSGNSADKSSGSEGKNSGDWAKLIQDIFFDYDDATLSPAARDQLSTNASHLSEMTSLKLLIEGHCDERGTVEYNLALGQRRADAARGYLVNLGVEASRLMTRSLGEERPFADGHDESAWSQNRRAHFVVQNP